MGGCEFPERCEECSVGEFGLPTCKCLPGDPDLLQANELCLNKYTDLIPCGESIFDTCE
jgi:hypothetical protein